MKALILQHEESTPPGSTIEWLEQQHFTWQLVELHKCQTLPHVEDFDILIICGGTMNVDEEAKFPWLIDEKSFIKKAIAKNKLVIGLCLGSQLIAEVLGAKVGRHPHPEVGWHAIGFTSSAPSSYGNSIQAFQFHSYSFALPPGAELLGSSLACENQAFAYRHNVLAFQFHPESTVPWVRQCAESKNIPPGEFCQNREQILANLSFQKDLQIWYFKALNLQLLKWQKGELHAHRI